MSKIDKKEDRSFDGFSSMYKKYVEYITTISSKKRTMLLIWSLVLIAVLGTLGSLPLIDTSWWIWVQTIVAFPAGIILFALLVGMRETTQIKNWGISKFKANNSHLQRIKKVSISAAVITAIFIVSGQFLPYGFGGILVIAAILVGYATLMRTPEEIIMASKGIIDVRDIKKVETTTETTDITNKDVK